MVGEQFFLNPNIKSKKNFSRGRSYVGLATAQRRAQLRQSGMAATRDNGNVDNKLLKEEEKKKK